MEQMISAMPSMAVTVSLAPRKKSGFSSLTVSTGILLYVHILIEYERRNHLTPFLFTCKYKFYPTIIHVWTKTHIDGALLMQKKKMHLACNMITGTQILSLICDQDLLHEYLLFLQVLLSQFLSDKQPKITWLNLSTPACWRDSQNSANRSPLIQWWATSIK